MALEFTTSIPYNSLYVAVFKYFIYGSVLLYTSPDVFEFAGAVQYINSPYPNSNTVISGSIPSLPG